MESNRMEMEEIEAAIAESDLPEYVKAEILVSSRTPKRARLLLLSSRVGEAMKGVIGLDPQIGAPLLKNPQTDIKIHGGHVYPHYAKTGYRKKKKGRS